jgi:NitT/TauT family transport system substrate-binding protein
MAFLSLLGGTVGAAEKFEFNLGWVPFGRDVAWFTALEKGYYRDEGLDVKIVRGFGGRDTTLKIAAGQADIGTMDTASIVVGQDKGLGVRMVLMQHDIAPYVVWTTKGSGINKIQDLQGRSLGTPQGDATWSNFPALAEINKFDIRKINVINIEPASRAPMLMAGRYDASTGFVLEYPLLAFLGKKNKRQPKFLLLAKCCGLDIYGVGLGVTNKTIAKRQKALRGFLKASVRGLSDAIADPDGSMQHLFKNAPMIKKLPNRMVWDITQDLWLTPDQNRIGLGRMTREKWVRTRDILVKANNIKKNIPVESLYSNDHLPKVMPPKRGPRKIKKLF